jgi:hypothetical protein
VAGAIGCFVACTTPSAVGGPPDLMLADHVLFVLTFAFPAVPFVAAGVAAGAGLGGLIRPARP